MPARVVPFNGKSKRHRFLGMGAYHGMDAPYYWDENGMKRVAYFSVSYELARIWGDKAKVYPKPGHWFCGVFENWNRGSISVVVTGPDLPIVYGGAEFPEMILGDLIELKYT